MGESNRVFISCFILLFLTTSSSYGAEKKKIGIIGGGIGGTTCAYFLKEYLGNNVEIVLFEKEEDLGGRLNVVNVGGRYYESGGSTIHPRNKIVEFMRQKFGLKKRAEGPSSIMGIYNGDKFSFIGSKYSFVTLIKLIFRYGFDVIRSSRFIKGMLGKFDNVYEAQRNGHAFSTVDNLLHSMSPEFQNLLNKRSVDYLLEKGFGEGYIQDLAEAAMLVNYGQSAETLHAFVGSVALAGAEGGLWSVEGGNRLLAEGAFNNSGASREKCKVDSIRRQSDGKFTVKCLTNSAAQKDFNHFDYVVIAVPLISGQQTIELEGFPVGSALENLKAKYHRTVATLVQGQVAPEGFHFELSGDLPDEILLSNGSFFYKSIGRIVPVDLTKGEKLPQSRRKRVHKVFSSAPLTNHETDFLFRSVVAQKSVDWFAYPEYADIDKLQHLPFVIEENLFYINSIEWAASAMEMSAIGARNVALLITNKEENAEDKIDSNIFFKQKNKAEL